MIHSRNDRMEFSSADDANIPVDIWLTKEADEPRWVLRASNYMPRKECLHPHGYHAESESREELADLIMAHVMPLYETAVRQLKAIASGEADSLYYWHDVTKGHP